MPFDPRVFDSFTTGVWITDAALITLYVNPYMASLLGRRPADIQGAPLPSFVAPGARDRLLESVRPSGAAAGPADVTLERADGSQLPVTLSASPLPQEQGEPPAIACVVVDMTRRSETEAALRRSAAYYRTLTSAARDHIFVINRDDRIEYVNQAAAEQLRSSPDRLIGLRRTEIFPPEIAERQGANLRKVFAEGKPLYAEGRTMYVDREVWLSTWLAPIHDESGTVTGVLGLSRDITERRQLEAELSNAQKMEAIGRLAGGIAHDFNNNLTAIIGYVDMILGQIGPDKPISGDLIEVQRAAERAAGLVRRLLAFGRRQVIQPRDLDLNNVVDGLKPMLERLIGEFIKVDASLDPNVPSVVGDQGQVEQVVMNLALNARDAMPSGGTLRIATSVPGPGDRLPAGASGSYVLMTIGDTGTGMDAGTKAHLFEPFFTTKPVGKGTGLGLSTVYGIVKQLNGFITVESEIDRGTTFRIFLPASDRAAEPAPAAVRPGPPVVGRDTILLVEDEDAVRRFAKVALERHGFHVIDTGLPNEALAIASDLDRPLAMLLTDVVMPQMSGPELVAKLKAVRPELPVLYMSGYPAGMVMQSGGDEAGVRLLPKPFTTAELLSNIEATLAGDKEQT